MSRDKPWLKMWTEWLGDAKMDRLSLAEQGAWWRLLSLAHECGHIDRTGKVPKADGALAVGDSPLSLAEIMKSLKITDEADKATFNQMLEKMKGVDSLHWHLNTLFITHYEERQRASTDTKEARRQRQRDRRERLKAKEETTLSQESRDKALSLAKEGPKDEPERTPGPSPNNKDKDIEEEGEGDIETHAQTSNGKSVTIAELSRCYEKYIGLLNPLDADRMREFTEYYESHEGEIDWIEKAFKNAPVNKRRWPYIQAILERYIEEGGPDGRAGQELERAARGGATARRGSRADRRDSQSSGAEYEWKTHRGDEPNSAEPGDKN